MSVAAVSRTWKKPPLIKSAWLRWTLIAGVVVYLALVTQTTPVDEQIAAADADKYVAQGIANLRTPPAASGQYYADWVLDQVASYVNYADRDVVVVTTIDRQAQIAAEGVVAKLLAGDATKNAGEALGTTPKVKDAIIADPQLKDARNVIDVDSKDNVVHLKGHVYSAEMKDKAGKVAQKALNDMNSTETISNELVVQP